MDVSVERVAKGQRYSVVIHYSRFGSQTRCSARAVLPLINDLGVNTRDGPVIGVNISHLMVGAAK